MLNILILLQYSLLNGFLLHHFFLKTHESSKFEILLSSIILSLSLNSLALYLAARGLKMPITANSVILLSLGISFALIIIGFIYERTVRTTTQKR